MYNGVNVIKASTTLTNYFFGGAGNLTMAGIRNAASGYQALLANTSASMLPMVTKLSQHTLQVPQTQLRRQV